MSDKDLNYKNDDQIEESNAARRIRLLGQVEEEKNDEPIKVNKLANFWYHNKVIITTVAVFAIIFGVTIGQFVSRKNPDVVLIYAGPQYITPNEARAFCSAVESILPDYNENGKIDAELRDFIYMTDEQFAEAKAEAEAIGVELQYDVAANKTNDQLFSIEIFSGESMICFLSSHQYDMVLAADAFVPLSELFEKIPDGAIDEYGIKLSETKFYRFYDALKVLPDDIVIAVRKVTAMSEIASGKSKTQKIFEQNCDLFKRIMTFEYPEGYVEPEETENN